MTGHLIIFRIVTVLESGCCWESEFIMLKV